jgi:hypothetical protein
MMLMTWFSELFDAVTPMVLQLTLYASPVTRRVSPPSSTTRAPSHLEPPLNLHVRCLDLVNTVTPLCTLALVDVSRCQPLRLVTRPPGPSVQASRPSFTAPGPSAQHVPT